MSCELASIATASTTPRTSSAPGAQLGNKLGVPNANVTPQEQNLPIFSPANYLGIGQTRSLPIFRRENTYQVVDNISFTAGKHTLKWGGDFRRRQLTIYQTNQGNGRFNFSPALTDSRNPAGTGGDSAASFLLGYATLIAHDYTQNWPGERGYELGVYMADDWRVTSKLTINLGLRWDYFSPFSEVANRWANFNLLTAKIDVAGRNGVSSRQQMFGPTIPTSVRASASPIRPPSTRLFAAAFGLFYNPTGSESNSLRLFRQLPYGTTISISPGDIFPGTAYCRRVCPVSASESRVRRQPERRYDCSRPGIPSLVRRAVQFRSGARDHAARDGHTSDDGRKSGTASVQHMERESGQFPEQQRSTHGAPITRSIPNLSDVNYCNTTGLSNYYAFQLSVNKRLRQGVSALLGYTWSHSIDDVQLEFGGGAAGPQPQDPRNIGPERASSNFDIRHRLTLSYLWELPFGKGRAMLNRGGISNFVLGGWQTNGILTVQTGLPFSPVLQTVNHQHRHR